MLAEDVRETIIHHFENLALWGPHWPQSAVIVTGSSVRGTTDEFADVDVNVYVPQGAFGPLYADYQRAVEEGRVEVLNPSALKHREFPFVLVTGVRGHYRVHVLEELENQIADHDDVAMWIQQRSVVLHDPSGRYSAAQAAAAGYPEEVWRKKLRFHIVEAIYAAGAASNPLRRNDLPAVTLTMTACAAHALRLCCLLDRSRFGTTNGSTVRRWTRVAGASSSRSSRSCSQNCVSRR